MAFCIHSDTTNVLIRILILVGVVDLINKQMELYKDPQGRGKWR